MVDLKSIDLVKNEVTFPDHTIITHEDFYNKFIQHWDGLIAGETLSPVHMERFMRRTSTKNSADLIRGKKVEGYMEGRFGKKMDPAWIKMLLVIGLVSFVGLLAVFIMQKMGFL